MAHLIDDRAPIKIDLSSEARSANKKKNKKNQMHNQEMRERSSGWDERRAGLASRRVAGELCGAR